MKTYLPDEKSFLSNYRHMDYTKGNLISSVENRTLDLKSTSVFDEYKYGGNNGIITITTRRKTLK